ncbi:hypothetical protein FJZ36_13740 [Candidatus Poribacteria bacterium]|nr:hypothetical protein [Candidatus Poribacteria bacterium]
MTKLPLVLVAAMLVALTGCGRRPEVSGLARRLVDRQLPTTDDTGSRAASMAMVGRALAALKSHDTDAAEDWLASAIALDFSNPYPYHVLGIMAFDARDFGEAAGTLAKAAALHRQPNEWALECHLLLGAAENHEQEWAAARAAYEVALRVAPDQPDAKRGLQAAEKHLERQRRKEEPAK